jgi:anaerobic ribonucleoside-triphosphate reductase
MKIKFIKNRDGDLVPFDRSRIERAVEKAAEVAKHSDFSFVDELTDNIIDTLKTTLVEADNEKVLTIEEIQDVVENKLMEFGYFDIAKKYIIYREKRAFERDIRKKEIQEKLSQNTLEVTKSNGEKEYYDIEKIKETYKRVSF